MANLAVTVDQAFLRSVCKAVVYSHATPAALLKYMAETMLAAVADARDPEEHATAGAKEHAEIQESQAAQLLALAEKFNFEVNAFYDRPSGSHYVANVKAAMGCPAYYTVLVPWTYDTERRTEWHPTESTGAFSTLTRGTFKSEDAAHEWAKNRLNGTAYTVKAVW